MNQKRKLWTRFIGISVGLLLMFTGLCGGAVYLVYENVSEPEFAVHDGAVGRFTVEFPGKPWRANPVSWGHGGITSFPMVAFERTWPDETYAIAWRDLDEDELQFGPGVILNSVIDGSTSFNPILKEVLRREELTVHGHPAVEVVLAVHYSQGKGYLRAVLAGKRLYVLSVGGAWIQDDSVRAKYFLNSFQPR
ncbi:hypothetical protein BH11PLA2_BH11PLA2_05740 [soil metagenome]